MKKSIIKLVPFVDYEKSGLNICSNGKRFAKVWKNHTENQWYLETTIVFPKYLCSKDEKVVMPIEFTMTKLHLLNHVQTCRDKAMSKYKSQIKFYHTDRLEKQLSRYK